jgi:FkbM family methyltransferase
MTEQERPQKYSLTFRMFKMLQNLLRGSGLGQVKALRDLRDAIYRIVRPRERVLLKIQGLKMELDPAQMGVVPELLRDGIFERCETELIRSLLKPGHVVVDVGGNIGYYSLIAADIVGSAGRVYTFEPEPSNFAFLERNVQINAFRNITLERFALSNTRESKRLFLNSTNSGGHHLYDAGEGEESVTVETITLDEYLAGKELPVHLVKMDIEGFEPFAFEGMKRVLAANPGVRLLTEFFPNMMATAGASSQDYLNGLKQLGFSLLLVDEVHNTTRPATEADIFAYCEKHLYANLLCERRG